MNAGTKANDAYVQQWVRLGLGYDLSPDVNFYMEIIDAAVWGGNGNQLNAGNGGDRLNHNGTALTGANQQWQSSWRSRCICVGQEFRRRAGAEREGGPAIRDLR